MPNTKATSKHELNGPVGLLVAVIDQAAADMMRQSGATSADWLSAWLYFASDNYQNHLDNIGLALDMLPDCIVEMPEDDLVVEAARVVLAIEDQAINMVNGVLRRRKIAARIASGGVVIDALN